MNDNQAKEIVGYLKNISHSCSIICWYVILQLFIAVIDDSLLGSLQTALADFRSMFGY